MSRSETAPRLILAPVQKEKETLPPLREIMEKLDVYELFGIAAEQLPFSLNDTTAGGEAELQAVVVGKQEDVDLPITIRQSHYFANMTKRTAAGELPNRAVTDLERYLDENSDGVWENSWVRFPAALLGPSAREVFQNDLLADKADPSQGNRTDLSTFLFAQNGQEYIRIPISYLLKIALADAGGGQAPLVAETGKRLMDHFLSDNTSPETFSFHVSSCSPETPSTGAALAAETAKRFLLTQLLIQYANERYGLSESGQRAMVFYSPHPPIRQKRLNGCISDAFYRELFMNPCLSGWNRGEVKQEYMHLCHQVLSRSQLNALGKLREAGIITRNLVVLPNTSNISLANNGTHISLGSRKLTALLADPASGFTRRHEKYLGDLVLKINEHFLPLFVGTYTATPYRLDFTEFHPESVLGFLPHELDFTHLRMLWRRWRKKAEMNVFGQPVTPFGPAWLDGMLSALFGLRGDFIPDFRLIDYLVALRSTEESPALDGTLHNHDRLKQDLSELGVFDKRMSLYLFNKLREFGAMGFSGFEGRTYSLFFSFADMAKAVDLQTLLTALAFQYLAEERVTHADIPDNPFVESERRQIIFGRAMGIPTFFIREDSENRFLKRIVERSDRVRPSRRYPGYLRVYHREYCRSLVRIIKEDAADLIDALGMADIVADLEQRIEAPERCAALGKLTRDILKKAKVASPMQMKARDFNKAAEDYYREELRKSHMREGLRHLEEALQRIAATACPEREALRGIMKSAVEDLPAAELVREMGELIVDEKAPPALLQILISLLIATVAFDRRQAEQPSLTAANRPPRKRARA
ncbi:MAG: hypothetical protein M0009_13420 [Deltaproteobacteria bacterium]|nr:hypothetical protein [Deltaproteobacteria bacterium]